MLIKLESVLVYLRSFFIPKSLLKHEQLKGEVQKVPMCIFRQILKYTQFEQK